MKYTLTLRSNATDQPFAYYEFNNKGKAQEKKEHIDSKGWDCSTTITQEVMQCVN